ncbi:hypothetical protein [Chakrabartyella piscis]|uniref:hypothetical protein n=1 Tax=Chakrabartyella piscis TaxID=2918914 RepID=UPI0029583E6C|nr:hypothetical protein [Chakrabartyella piscis]
MKLINKPIDVISWTDEHGVVTPVRFRVKEKEDWIVVSIAKILEKRKDRFSGSDTLHFHCISSINGVDKMYELTCNCSTQKWLLKKI